jgi:polyphosphate kinase
MVELFFNRELSWLKFNERVLEEACDVEKPLLERLKFVSIFTSNLDEFYMVRVGSLFDQSLIGTKNADTKTSMLPAQQIKAINEVVAQLYPRRDEAYQNIMKSLANITYSHSSFKSLEGGERHITKEYFQSSVMPLLSPQIIDLRHPFPHLENKQQYIGVRLKSKDSRMFGIIPLPREFERIYIIPGSRSFLLTEDIVLRYADIVFGVYNVESKAIFRVTRNADIDINEGLFDEDTDYRNVMREILKKRGKLSPVRLETNSFEDNELLNFFSSRLDLNRSQCFLCHSPLDMNFVFKLEDSYDVKIRERLLFAPVKPQWPSTFEHSHIMSQVQKNDLMLSYPFESMRPFIELVREASEDSRVLSIKMTLYRVGRQSQIVQHLCAAAENGKDVTVVVELRARFDEQNNINWANFLEEAGCKVIYGIEEYKIHGKIVLITLKTHDGTRYITNISTGNYNETTAKLYTDLSMLTADQEIGEDAVQFFNNVNIGNISGKYRHLLVAPSSLKIEILAHVAEEVEKAVAGQPAYITFKMNSLSDKEVIEALVVASQAGVKIKLITRGICCLRPGVSGFTDNIEVISIVGRFLEHSRIYSFGEGSQRKIFISSADMMTRNTQRRLEIAAPVYSPLLVERISNMLDVILRDNVKARILKCDGTYSHVINSEKKLDSQKYFYDEAYLMAEKAQQQEQAKAFVNRSLFTRLFKRRD